MIDRKTLPKDAKVGGHIFEELAFKHLVNTYNISDSDLLKIIESKRDSINTFSISILRTPQLSSLEAIVKFLRENRNVSYKAMGLLLNRNPKTLAVTYAVSRRKMPEQFSKKFTEGIIRIPFTVFSERLSILESICMHLNSCDYTYVEISRMLGRDQRTIWTVCKRAEKKLAQAVISVSKPVSKSISKDSMSIELALKHFANRYNISKKDILDFAEDKRSFDNSIPSTILRIKALSSLEAIVKFLRENRNVSYKAMGLLLNRNPKTLAVTYCVAKSKNPNVVSNDVEKDLTRIPFTAFNNNFSILESICVHLKSSHHSYADVARIINKDQRTVWTVCMRAESKLKKEDNDR